MFWVVARFCYFACRLSIGRILNVLFTNKILSILATRACRLGGASSGDRGLLEEVQRPSQAEGKFEEFVCFVI